MTAISHYQGHFYLKTTDSEYAQKTSSKFHMELLECLDEAIISTKYEQISLRPYDIILATGFKNVEIIGKNPHSDFRLLETEVEYPAPLNQYLVADNALIHDLMNDNSGKYAFIIFRNLDDGLCNSYFDSLEILAKRDGDEYDAFQTGRLFGLLLTELLHKHRQKIAKSSSVFPRANVRHANRDAQSGAIMHYLASKSGQVSLNEAAQHFGYQKNYFSRLCHKLFGMDFIHLRINIRMNIADEQLRLTNKSIEEISQELGYQDSSAFSKTFAECKGMTPGKFRKTYGFKVSSEKPQKDNP